MKPTPETERRYKLAIYELPYDTNYRANYQVWKTVKILKEHMERFERERDEASEQRDRLAEALQDAMEHIPSTMQKSAIEALAAVKGGSDE